jgi:hypothetical protein
MLAPFFSEDGDCNLIAAIEQMNLIHFAYADDRAGCQAYLDRFGGGDVIFWDCQLATLPPQVFVVKETDKRFNVVLAGTTNWKQWVGNFWGAYSDTWDDDTSKRVHSFFLKERDRIWNAAVADILSTYGDDVHVRFSGHSMGGAVAELLAYHVSVQSGKKSVTEVLTFAAPKTVAGEKDRPGEVVLNRITHVGDIVPYTPPISVFWMMSIITRGVNFFPQPDYWFHPTGRIVIDERGRFENGGSPENEFIEFRMPEHKDGFLANHIWPRYILSLAATAFRFPAESFTEDEKARIQAATSAAGGSVPSVFVPLPLPSTFTDPATVNRALVGSATGPVTPQNINSLGGSTAFATGTRVPTRNIGGLSAFGDIMPTRSAYTKVTLIINNGQSGVSHSFVTAQNSSSDFAQVQARAFDLAEAWSNLFGNDSTVGALPVKSLGSPCAEFIRFSDPLAPRLGILTPLNITKSARFFGKGRGVPDSADRFSTTLSIRMQGQGPDRIGYANLSLLGQPDGVVVQGRYNGDFTLANASGETRTYDVRMTELLQYLVDRQWGFMGRKWSEPDLVSDAILLDTNSYPIFTIAGHPYVTDDIIVIKGTDKPGLPHKGRVVKIDANTFRIKTKWTDPNAPRPQTATVYRVKKADGTILLDFYQFKVRPEGWTTPLQVQVRSHRPGRQFVAVSFGKHGQRKRI